MRQLTDDTPFGWKRRKGILIANDLEQWVIKRILAEKIAGKPLEDISRDLMKIGIKPRNGGEWFPRRINKVLLENEQLNKSVINETEKPTEQKVENVTSKEKMPDSNIFQADFKKPIRTGAIIYEIKDSRQAVEKCESEAEHRSCEVGKIVSHALLFAVAGKRREQQLMKGTEDEVQNRDICESEH